MTKRVSYGYVPRGYICFIFLVTFFFIDSNKIFSQELVFGSRVEQISAKNIDGEQVLIPLSGTQTLLFFFDINYPPYKRILYELSILTTSIYPEKEIVKLIAISKGDRDDFSKLQSELHKNIEFINDRDNVVYKYFRQDCGECLKIILFDSTNNLRYLSSGYDPLFIREIILRYGR